MAKRRKPSASFSVESLREEVEAELTNEKVATNVLQDLRSIRLDSVDFVSPDVLLCVLTVKFGITLVVSIARVLPSLRVLPADVRRQVLKLLCPHLNEGESETLFKCVARLPNLPASISFDDSDEFHVFSPPCGQCVCCHSHLVGYNSPVKVDYYHLHGSSKGVKISLKCSGCGIFYGYTKYGNPASGWNLYDLPRTAVEASDVCFVQRSLLNWQISLA